MTGVTASIGSPAHSERSLLLARSPPVDGAMNGQTRTMDGFVAVKKLYDVGDPERKMLSASHCGTSTYGTLPLNQAEEIDSSYGMKKRIVGLLQLEPEIDLESGGLAHNNQSETESDSDGSCGSSAALPPALQSILRMSASELSCRSMEKKNSSVEFAIDIDDTDDEDDEYEDDDKLLKARIASARRKSCTSRCYPRRLTLEEKAELYRVRPDLELTPMPVLLRDLEENRRRRQRKLVFSLLGGTLMLLMMIVMYYVFSQV